MTSCVGVTGVSVAILGAPQMRAPLLLLAAFVALGAAFGVFDQMNFPTDIADPACLQARTLPCTQVFAARSLCPADRQGEQHRIHGARPPWMASFAAHASPGWASAHH